ncbi:MULTISPECIES: hypothetical protein [unclassified Nonomuraea]|uniref:hypothetical protein n=1 Tax=unclassified Nonomuraea TaxID=2593643 RepID=UPI0035C2040B
MPAPTRVRSTVTDPLLAAAALAMLAIAAAALQQSVLCWAAVGAMAGYSLSGSV